MTTKTRRVPVGAERQFPLWCKGGKPRAWSPEESAKGFHSCATRPRPAGRQDGGYHRAHQNVTTRGCSQAKTTFVRIDCTTCPLSNPAVVESLPADLGRGPRPLYIGLSHHHKREPKSEQVEHHTSSRTPHLLRINHPLY